MKSLMVCLLASAPGFGLSAAQEGSDKKCDLKKIEKTPYCSACPKFDPELDDEGLCLECGTKPQKVDACVKVYFQCSACDKKSLEDKACCKESTNRKIVVKALIVFRCENCGASADKEGDCDDEECKEKGFKVKKTCDQSGSWPHGGELDR